MPILRPIRPFRYGFDRVDQLGELVSPATRGEPEDRLRIGDVHEYNIRRLVRGVHGPQDTSETPPFTFAAALQQRWKEDGVIVREPRPAYYAYEQRLDGVSYRGAVCLVRLAPYDDTQVRPHERTQRTGAMTELLAQLSTLRTQLSMVMAFVPDTSGALAAFLDRRDEPAWLAVQDGRGVMNRLWREQDPAVHVRLAEALCGETAVIADGHHRHRAALLHQAKEAETGPVTRESPYDYVMMLLRPVAEGAARSITHRVFERLSAPATAALESAIDSNALQTLADSADPGVLSRLDDEDAPGLFGVVTPGRARVVRVTDAASAHPAVRALPEALRTVDAALLAALLLDPVMAAATRDTAADSRSGHRFSPNQVSAAHVASRALAGEVAAAFLLRTASPELVQRIAAAGQVMPPRSTKFLPKPVKGLLMSSLVSF
jgi:uncharacterized protein (DUF1015 family)